MFSIDRRLSYLVAALLLVLPAGAQEPKNPLPGIDHGLGVPPESVGGPDAFGYTFADQDEAICPLQMVDISATGALIDWGIAGPDDSSSGPIALSAPFNFYGTSYTELAMATNGYLSTDPDDPGTSLGGGFPVQSMCPLPDSLLSGDGARMYPLLDDLVAPTAYVEYFSECPRPSERCRAVEDCTIFFWHQAHHFGTPGDTFDIEAILYHQTNDLIFQIGPGNPELGTASTTGIQSGPTDPLPPTYPTGVPGSGLTYACDTAASVPDDSAVCFFHPNTVPDACVFSDLEIAKLSDAGPRQEPGSLVVFSLTVTNNGPDDARGTTVTDALDPDVTWVSDDCGAGPPDAGGVLTWEISNLPSSSLAACNITVEVTGDRGSTVENTASVSLDNFDPDTANNVSNTVTFDIGFISDVGITKTLAADPPVEVGETVSYTLGLSNQGPDPTVGAVVTDQLPDEVTYLANDCGAPAPVMNLFTWSPGEVTAAASTSCTIDVMVDGPIGATVVNIAQVAVENIEPDLSDNTSDPVSFQIGPISDLAIEKISDFVPLQPVVTYSLTVTHLGGDPAEGVTVTDQLPDEIVYTGDTCGAGPPVAGLLTWDIGSLSALEEASCDIMAQIPPIDFAVVVNTAQVTSDSFDPDLSNNQSSEIFEVMGPGFIFADGFESGDLGSWSSQSP